MTTFFNILFFIHLFGIAGYRYLYYDQNKINNENILKWLLNLLGIKNKDEYEHSQAYSENISYKNLFTESFPKFILLSKLIFAEYILAIFMYAAVRIYIHEFIDSIFNSRTIPVIIIMIVIQYFFYLAYLMPEYKNAPKEVKYFKEYFEPALRIFVYCSSYLITVSTICLLNYYVPNPDQEERIVKIKDSYKILYVHTGLFEQKIHNAVQIEPEIFGKKFISVSNEILNNAQKGNKLKLTINKGFLGASFIEKEEIVK